MNFINAFNGSQVDANEMIQSRANVELGIVRFATLEILDRRSPPHFARSGFAEESRKHSRCRCANSWWSDARRIVGRLRRAIRIRGVGQSRSRCRFELRAANRILRLHNPLANSRVRFAVRRGAVIRSPSPVAHTDTRISRCQCRTHNPRVGAHQIPSATARRAIRYLDTLCTIIDNVSDRFEVWETPICDGRLVS